MEKFSLTFILPSLRGGGAEKVIVRLLSHLQRKGHNVQLLITGSDADQDISIPDTVNVTFFEKNRTIFSFFDIFFYMRSHKNDFLISSLTHLNLIVLVCGILARASDRIVVVEHNNLHSNIESFNFLQSIIFKKFGSYFYKKCHSVVTVSNGVKKSVTQILNLRSEMVQVINNAVFDNFCNAQCQIKKRNQKQKKIAVIGRLVAAKNHTLALDAFKAVLQIRDDFHLDIIGQGPLRDTLVEHSRFLGINDHVSFLGYVKDIEQRLADYDILLLTSNYEGLPTVLIEALRAPIHRLSTDCDFGPSEILCGGEYGILFPVGDLDAIVSAILDVSDLPASCACSRAADFSAPVVAEQYLDLIANK